MTTRRTKSQAQRDREMKVPCWESNLLLNNPTTSKIDNLDGFPFDIINPFLYIRFGNLLGTRPVPGNSEAFDILQVMK